MTKEQFFTLLDLLWQTWGGTTGTYRKDILSEMGQPYHAPKLGEIHYEWAQEWVKTSCAEYGADYNHFTHDICNHCGVSWDEHK